MKVIDDSNSGRVPWNSGRFVKDLLAGKFVHVGAHLVFYVDPDPTDSTDKTSRNLVAICKTCKSMSQRPAYEASPEFTRWINVHWHKETA